MAYLIAGLVLVGALSVLNLALTLAVARRLRTGTAPKEPRRPGERVAEIAGRFDSVGLVAFLSPSCPPCQEERPHVLAYAREVGAVLAVVVDDNEDPAKVAAEIAEFDAAAGVAAVEVVVAHTGDRLTTAFGVDAYPAVFLVDAQGVVMAAGHDVASLRPPVRVP